MADQPMVVGRCVPLSPSIVRGRVDLGLPRYRLAVDDSSHYYLIPDERRREWWEWCESQDARDGIVPDWAKRIDGWSHFTFTDPRED
jgi:hypothetical protein